MKLKFAVVVCLFFSIGSPLYAETTNIEAKVPSEQVDRTRIGLGLFWLPALSSSILRPDGGIFRITFPSGLSIEPSLSYVQDRRKNSEVSTSDHYFSLSTLLRTPIAKRRSIELSAQIGVHLSASQFQVEDNQGQFHDEEVVSGGLLWGIGIERFFGDDYSFGLNATSNVFGIQRAFGDTFTTFGPFASPSYKMSATMYF